MEGIALDPVTASTQNPLGAFQIGDWTWGEEGKNNARYVHLHVHVHVHVYCILTSTSTPSAY